MFTYYLPNKVGVNSVKAFARKARSPLSVISVRQHTLVGLDLIRARPGPRADEKREK